jgi:uncharacterized membrane protein YfcA
MVAARGFENAWRTSFGAGALMGSRILPYADVKWLRIGCVIILAVIAIVMGWRTLTRI